MVNHDTRVAKTAHVLTLHNASKMSLKKTRISPLATLAMLYMASQA